MNKINQFNNIVEEIKNGEATIVSPRKLNECRLRFILENGLCEETLNDIFIMSQCGDVLSNTVADGLISKYLYEPPAINKGMASTIRKAILPLFDKYDIGAVNKMIESTLYTDVSGVKYAIGLGQIVQNIKSLNNL